jgi:D-serine deaminase-like pyridoxal phosphate-dependent protein
MKDGYRLFVLAGGAAMLIAAVQWYYANKSRAKQRKEKREIGRVWEYSSILTIVEENKLSLPCMLVDVDVYTQNFLNLFQIAAKHKKKLRLASKSIRSVELIRMILNHSHITEIYNHRDYPIGIMCFSVAEAVFLYQQTKVIDLLVAYPTVQECDVIAAYECDAEVTLMIDSCEHVALLDAIIHQYHQRNPGRIDAAKKLRVCIDIDVGYPLFGLHLGAHRSPVRSTQAFQKVVDAVLSSSSHLVLVGAMSYDAHIAGVTDMNPFAPALLNHVIRLVKKLAFPLVSQRRRETMEYMQSKGIRVEIMNGGGTGSLLQSCSYSDGSNGSQGGNVLTEVTAGSGFLQSSIFDYFQSCMDHPPAFVFCLQITRSCEPGVFCAQSGGFIASGAISKDKQPVIYRPEGAVVFDDEGFGEVQTPFTLAPNSPDNHLVRIGGVLVLRPAKAGEISERFNEYVLVKAGKVIGTCKTYRGDGQAFY